MADGDIVSGSSESAVDEIHVAVEAHTVGTGDDVNGFGQYRNNEIGLSGRGARIIEFIDDELFVLLYRIDRFLVVIVGDLQASLGCVGFFSGVNDLFFFWG